MASSSHRQKKQDQDQFDCLSDDLLLFIINKLLEAKALIRVSLVSKRFFSLIFKTHSVSVDLYLPSGHLPKGQNPCFILNRFQQLKHLHVRFCAREPSERDSHDLFRGVVLEYEMLECVVFSDDFRKSKVIMMGKEQIARLRNSSNGISNVRALAYSVPNLHLRELGYTMKDVLFVRGIAENENAKEVVIDVPFLNQSDFKDWQVFNAAVQVLMDKIRRE
ncbi:hypothetical protein PTKIN_Ptkin01aG0386700 [Pterospermum kingtungense]